MTVAAPSSRTWLEGPIDVAGEEVDASVLRHDTNITMVADGISEPINNTDVGPVVLRSIGLGSPVAQLGVYATVLVVVKIAARIGARHEGDVPVDLDVDVPAESDSVHTVASG